ncbi:methyl-accepting chemotaxis protein [Terrarubrum flagellatum]|uniref:methyl-accepting chemotaxis protein n=1 Tax=Terrirubrum flagellatum TaxID=2895980 RepID=UPI003144DCE0
MTLQEPVAEGQATRGAKTIGVGIRGTLTIAFSIVAVLTLVATAVALFSFQRINQAFERVSDDGIKAITSSLDLARRAAEITSAAPSLISAPSSNDVAAIRRSLEAWRGAAAESLTRLDGTSIGRGAVRDLSAYLRALDENMGALAPVVETRLTTMATRERMSVAAAEAHERLSAEMATLIDDASFKLLFNLEDPTRRPPGNAALASKLVESDGRSLLDLMDVRAEANLVLGLLSEASLAPRAELLAPLQDRFLASSVRARKAAAQIDSAPRVRARLEELLKYGEGADSVFALRRRELASTAEGLALVQTTRAAAGRVSDEVSRFVDLARGNAERAIASSEDTISSARNLLIILTLLSFLSAVGLGWLYVGRRVARRLGALNHSMMALASGDLDAPIDLRGRDEISSMAKAVEVFRSNGRIARELGAEQLGAQAERERRHQAIERHIGEFDGKVLALLRTLASSSENMRATAGAMTATAEEATHQASSVTAGFGDAMSNAQNVAAAAEEMSMTISDIGGKIAIASEVAGAAVAESKRTDGIVRGLSESASRIGDIVELIHTIAAQTNLLALNATIEAARAGDAGRGFAIVAQEVKALAHQTARATEDISTQIAEIRGSTLSAVDAIKGIGDTIQRINQISIAISSAMSEQKAATNEIALRTQQTADGTRQAHDRMAHVNEAARRAGVVSNEVMTAAAALDAESGELRATVDLFLGQIRSVSAGR